MGIKKLRENLPRRSGDYLKLGVKKRTSMKKRVDAASALWVCAYRSKESYVNGDYYPAWGRWQRLVQQMKMVDFKAELVFDGKDSKHKQPERARRDAKQKAARERVEAAKASGVDPAGADLQALLRNEPLYIAGCIKIARFFGFKCRVMPYEADAYVGGVDCDGNVMSISYDGDMAYYCSGTWAAPADWTTGHAMVVDFGSFSDDDAETYPLVKAYRKHGKVAIAYVAAFAGCDMVKDGQTKGLGWDKILRALGDVDHLTPSNVVTYMKAHFSGVATKKKTDSQKKAFWKGATAAMQSVISGIAESVYYNDDGAVLSAAGKVKVKATDTTRSHMNGTTNPRTGHAFSDEEQEVLDTLEPSALTMPSQVPDSQLQEAADLGADPSTEEAKRFILAFGGSTRQSGKALSAFEVKDVAQKYRAMMKEVPIAKVNRTKSGGMWLNLNVNSQSTNKAVITKALKGNAIDNVQHMKLRSFLQEIKDLYDAGKFETDYDAIVRGSPEMDEHILRNWLAPLGSQSESGKAAAQARERATAPSELLYHAIARSEDGTRAFLSSQQRASMETDATAKGEHGEKNEKKPHMSLVELCVEPTSAETDLHELGRVYAIGRTWCTCTAGNIECGHKGATIEVQRLHWDEDRPEPKPTQFNNKQWGKHRNKKKRKASVKRPLHEMPVGPQSSAATQHRQVRDPAAAADYDVADGEVMERHITPARAMPLYRLIQAAQGWANKSAKSGGGDGSGSDSDG
jgi:hypothetical protein